MGHAGFYRRFIRDFSKIAKPLCRLLEKDAKFSFDEFCQSSCEEIRSRLVEVPIMAKPDWTKEFEIMCDASDYAMGAVLGQKLTRCLGPYTMPAKPSMKLKRTIQLLKKKCWPWYLHVKNSGLIFWDPMSSSIMIML